MKNLLLSIVGVILFIIFAGILTKNLKQKSQATVIFDKKEIKVGKTSLMVEIADNDEKRSLGLSKRESLKTYNGMFFIFPEKPIQPVFWMKYMKFPIDILWIKDGKIVQIDENIPNPPEGTPDNKLKLYRPKNPVDYVLEVDTLFTETNLIKVGDPVDVTSIFPS